MASSAILFRQHIVLLPGGRTDLAQFDLFHGHYNFEIISKSRRISRWTSLLEGGRSWEAIYDISCLIRDGRYVLLVLDEYCIKGSPAFSRSHFLHYHLVVGVDEDKASFALLNYFERQGSDYGVEWVSFATFWRAFDFELPKLRTQTQQSFGIWWHKYCEAICITPLEIPKFGAAELICQLDGLITSTGMNKYHGRHHHDLCGADIVYGLNAYSAIRCALSSLREGQRVDRYFGRLFWEHKKLM
ncbi:MAG: hypothetical protein SFV32_07160 [Opitutaceae bacterium]|nr:hypothetical protein [Opitutaceae bacterium]